MLTILGCEGLAALMGGALLAASPDGRYVAISVNVMHGIFRNFLIPGLLLFGLGLLDAVAFLGVIRRSRASWVGASLAILGMAIWFLVELAILRQLHWLHVMWGLPIILGGIVAFPLLPSRARRSAPGAARG